MTSLLNYAEIWLDWIDLGWQRRQSGVSKPRNLQFHLTSMPLGVKKLDVTHVTIDDYEWLMHDYKYQIKKHFEVDIAGGQP